ncbi:hypothetical protein [Desulfogranum marinum]|uniref:hypothetical protein n=1 Tax=Desulfogranum marinum TaxID=453220 RepID=UPI001965F0D4|nr:hypothetical protein [Desulfogranum marinum]MBM9512733.1 hypothetical protein [Desulfogranum marinum]
MLTCQRYIEPNPVRADTVEHPGEYRWSSYRANADGKTMELLTPHPHYMALGKIATHRQHAYKELFRYQLEPVVIDEIRKATNGNFVLGNDRFADEIASKLGRRVTRSLPGRPKKGD